ESEETLNRDYAEIARRLGLAVREVTETELVREGVKRWLAEHDGYLLVVDNADDPDQVAPYLPPAPPGHVLFTSRAANLSSVRVAQPLPLGMMPEAEAVQFLLTRAGGKEGSEAQAQAAELAKELGKLPLALEQAAAFIAAREISFAEYLKLYRRQ